MKFKKGQRIDLAALKEAVKITGFDLKWTDLLVTGVLVKTTGPDNEEALAIRVTSTGQQVFLGPGDSDESRRNYIEVERRASEKETRFRIQGRAHAHPDGTIGLSISKFVVLK